MPRRAKPRRDSKDELRCDLSDRCGETMEGLGQCVPNPSLRSHQMILHDFHRDERGLETMEYVILATLVTALMTLAIVALFNTIVAKIKEINSSL